MTTIACDGKAMASDGFITAGEVIVETNFRKVHKLNDGRIIGFAGNGYNWQPVLDYFNSDRTRKKWPHLTGNNSILVLDLDGRAWLYDNDGRTFERTVPCAVGTGWMFALGAMAAGATVAKAVEIAASRDTATGGTIFVEELHDDD